MSGEEKEKKVIIDEEVMENEKGDIIVQGKVVKRLRLINIKGNLVIRSENDIQEVVIENSNINKLRILTGSIVTMKNTRVKDALVIDLSPS